MKVEEPFQIDGTPITSKGTGIVYNDLHLSMLHSLARREVTCTTRDTFLCILTTIFMGGELVCSSPE